MPASRWMLVGKPLRAPFNDGSTVLVRDLVRGLSSHRPLTYFGDPEQPLRDRDKGDEVIDAAPMGHAPTLRSKLDVMRAIISYPRRRQPLHFFFTPNRVTSSALAGIRRLQPRRLLVQSLMSSHGGANHARLLHPLDAVVVLSDDTEQRMLLAGLAADRVVRIYPGVPLVAAVAREAPSRILYAGDLDAQVVDRLSAVAAGIRRGDLGSFTLTIACRPKAERDAEYRGQLRDRLAADLSAGRVELMGAVPDMDALMRRCAIQIFVADHVRRKVDLPLVVLEGLARGLGLVCTDFRPISEVFDRAAEHSLVVGAQVMASRGAQAFVDALRFATGDPATVRRWSADARTLVQREFSVDTMAMQYEQLYARLGER
ncbi:MAG: glycosyltransferase [Nannocystaceae bacterium]